MHQYKINPRVNKQFILKLTEPTHACFHSLPNEQPLFVNNTITSYQFYQTGPVNHKYHNQHLLDQANHLLSVIFIFICNQYKIREPVVNQLHISPMFNKPATSIYRLVDNTLHCQAADTIDTTRAIAQTRLSVISPNHTIHVRVIVL